MVKSFTSTTSLLEDYTKAIIKTQLLRVPVRGAKMELVLGCAMLVAADILRAAALTAIIGNICYAMHTKNDFVPYFDSVNDADNVKVAHMVFIFLIIVCRAWPSAVPAHQEV